jgi:RNA polymerase-binding transcription factor DksA
MKEKELKKIKNKLLRRHKKLEKELRRFATKDKSVDDNFNARFPKFGSKDDENAAEVATFTSNLSLEHSLELSLKEVSDALARLEQGKYGQCEICGQMIEPKRLKAFMSATTCIKCAHEK